MKITIHRGANQIGGCITEIATASTKIIIDLGHNLPKGNQPAEDDKANDKSIAELTDKVAAIFYTHYHGDHVDLFKFVPDGVKQYIGETAKKVMLLKYERLAKSSRFKKEVTPELLQKLRSFDTFKAQDKIKIGDISVTPYFVSHSACDAYMFVIEADGKRILHTGDFRGHGYLSKGLMPTIKKLILPRKTIDVLITEGTMLSRPNEKPMREQELQKEAIKLMKQYKYVFVLCSSTDMERLASFHAASKEAKRSFLCDKYQKDVLEIFTSMAKNDMFKFDNVNFYKHDKQHKQFQLIENKGFCMLIRGKYTHAPYGENAIRDLLQWLPQEQTLLIYSYWDGYLNEGENQIEDFTDIWNIFPNKVRLHTSGHASADCLAEVCQTVNPTTAIIPIHSQVSDDFKKLPLTDELKAKITTESAVKQGIEIKIGDMKNQPSIFELFEIEYGEYGYIDDENPPKYPEFEVHKRRLGLFSTLEKAEKAMKNYIETNESKRTSIFGFWIEESDTDNLTYSWTKSERNYLPDGSLLDECLVSSTFKNDDTLEEFLGRPTDKVRYKNGDLVEEIYGRDRVRLAIVGNPPWSPEKVSANKIRCEKQFGYWSPLDSSDDCYYTLGVSEDVDNKEYDTHNHPSPECLFPLRFPVSDELRSNLEKQYKRYRAYFDK